MQLRIRRYDTMNWVVEVFRAGGAFPGKEKGPDHWVIDGYYPNMRRALLAAPEAAVAPGTTGWADIAARLETVIARLEGLALAGSEDRLLIDLPDQNVEGA